MRNALTSLRRLFGGAGPHAHPGREALERRLAGLAGSAAGGFSGTVLVDGQWDNPNYWLRYALVRAGLGLSGSEVGLLGPHRADLVRRTCELFGMRRAVRLADFVGRESSARAEARRRLAATRDSAEILGWDLGGVPGYDLYDCLLKRQRNAFVRLDHPALEDDVTDYLRHREAMPRLFDALAPALVVTSHTFSGRIFTGPLVWEAARRGIPVIGPYGNYGVLRLFRIRQAEEVPDFIDSPSARDIDAVPLAQADALAAVGRAYLEARLGGRTDDLGSRYAFQGDQTLDRARACAHFGWDPARPVVAVYASTWFDAPHCNGMQQFRDFADWLQATLAVARGQREVSWLFRGHPCDAWYGGVTLRDLMPPVAESHVGLCPPEWSGSAVQRAADAVVTLSGTAAIEYAAAGKAALLGDRGWYHDRGFAKWSRSRAEYLVDLARPWWTDVDSETASRRAQIFAGWYFCRPAWHEGFHLEDDSEQDALYERIPALLDGHPHVVRREIDGIREWYASGERFYHSFKMRGATEYALPTPSGALPPAG
jgi:hypothetical protein